MKCLLKELRNESERVFREIRELEYKVMSLSEYETLLRLYRRYRELGEEIRQILQEEEKDGK